MIISLAAELKIVSFPDSIHTMQPGSEPDLTQYKEPLSHYIHQYMSGIAILNGTHPGDAAVAYRQRVEAAFGTKTQAGYAAVGL